MRRWIVVICCLAGFNAGAQTVPDTLQAFGSSPDLYIYHTVQKGETFFSLGRMFHISPYEVAKANGLTFDSTLHLYSYVKIPLTNNNFNQQTNETDQPGFAPVFHKVVQGETLYHIGQEFNKVPLQNIQAWNHLSNNNVDLGKYLVIGFVRYDQDAVINHPETNLAVASQPVENTQSSQPIKTDNNSHSAPVNNSNTTTSNTKNIIIPAPIMTRADSGIITNHSIATRDTFNNMANSVTDNNSPFESAYLQETSSTNTPDSIRGAGSWFSSNIPPGSKKYYVLFDSAARGEVIKIINPLNGKFIYAKVLDVIPKLGENVNIVVKISDAAQQDLGVMTQRFFCQVDYAKESNTPAQTQ
jgi:LysM repeat protein